MSKKLYIGNLPYSADDQRLKDTFSTCGSVESAKVIMDRDSGQSKGFAFVEMSSDSEAAQVIERYNGADWDGRAISISIAKPMAARENRRGGFSREANRGW